MHRLLAIITTACLALAITACGRQAPPTAPAKLRVAHLPIADCAQLYVGMAQGFFEQEGLDLEAITMASGVTILEALATSSVDIGFSATAPLILTKARGLDLVSVAGGSVEDGFHPEHGVIVAKDSPIDSPKNLEGTTVGIVAFRSIDEVFIKEWLARNGAKVDSVRFIEVPFPQMIPTLASKRIDAAAVIEPFLTAARLGGDSRTIGNHFVEVQPVVEISSYNTRREWADRNADVLRRFRAAFDRATEYANSRVEETKTLISTQTKLSPDIAREMVLPRYQERLSEQRLRDIADLMVKWQLIDNVPDVASLIYP